MQTAGGINAGGVAGAKLADKSVGTTKLADSCITSAKIADGAVGSVDIAAKAVTRDKLADVIAEKLSDVEGVKVSCPTNRICLDIFGQSKDTHLQIKAYTQSDYRAVTLALFVNGVSLGEKTIATF